MGFFDRLIQKGINAVVREVKKEVTNLLTGNLNSSFPNRRYTNVTGTPISRIDAMDGFAFQDFMEGLFVRYGYRVERTPKSNDYGADLILIDGNKRIVVQLKRYNGNVSNSAVQEVVAAKAYYNAQETWVVTNSYFTQNAKNLAKANRVSLIDRDALIKLINNVR